MKILFNTHFHAFQNMGGGEVVLLRTKEALEAKGIQVDLFDQWTSKLSNYDVIHDFSSLSWRNWHVYKSFGAKLAVTPVMWPKIQFPYPQLELIKGGLKYLSGIRSPEANFKEALKLPDIFFPTTLQEQLRIQTRYHLHDESRFQVIPNGVSLPPKGDIENSFIKEFKTEDYLLYVGRISPLKNVKMIIQAAKAAQKKLIIIGSHDIQNQNYANEVAQEASDTIKIISSVPSQSTLLHDAYRGAHAVIVASHFETCSLVGLEAATHNKPLIMTSAGATTEIYKDFVTYVDPTNLQSLIDAIHKIWPEKTNEKLKSHVENTYSWDRIADQLIESYQKLL